MFDGRENIIEGFQNGIFLFHYDEVWEEKMRFEEKLQNIRDENGLIDYKNLNRLIDLKDRDINDELVSEHFQIYRLNDMLKKSKTNPERNKI